MKTSTAELFKKHLDSGKFSFERSEEGIVLNHDLTNEEIEEIVKEEYSGSLTQPVEKLFEKLVVKIVKMGVTHAKATMPIADKLSDL